MRRSRQQRWCQTLLDFITNAAGWQAAKEHLDRAVDLAVVRGLAFGRLAAISLLIVVITPHGLKPNTI